MKAVRGASIEVGDLVWHGASRDFRRVVAVRHEQGSGPSPDRMWVALDGLPKIEEMDPLAHYVVRPTGIQPWDLPGTAPAVRTGAVVSGLVRDAAPADGPRLSVGAPVRTTSDAGRRDWDRGARDHVRWGVQGRVTAVHDSHGICYAVEHEDATRAIYDHDELASLATAWVICQEWEESERGWGVRPDGYSLHLSVADRDAFVRRHEDALPSDHVPDEYTRVCGHPFLVDVAAEIFVQVAAARTKSRPGIHVSRTFDVSTRKPIVQENTP